MSVKSDTVSGEGDEALALQTDRAVDLDKWSCFYNLNLFVSGVIMNGVLNFYNFCIFPHI